MFENIKAELKKLFDGEINRLDPDIIEEDLNKFFESTELNIYAGDKKAIKKALMSSGLIIKQIKHDRHGVGGAWIPITTTVVYALNLDPSTPEDAVFEYTWQ